jgi:hypothetical protein
MSSDYIPRLRAELLRAGAAQRRRSRWASVVRPLRPLAAVAVVALALAVVISVPGGEPERTAHGLLLSYRVAPAGAAARTVQVLRDRFAAAGVDGVGVAAAPGGTLTVTAPDGARAAVTALLQPGRLAIYDWEERVLGPEGRPAPRDLAVTGGGDAGRAAAVTETEAHKRAAGVPDIRVVRGLLGKGWFALSGEPALTNDDVATALAPQEGDPAFGTYWAPGGTLAGTGAGVVAIKLTESGRRAFTALTRELAQRDKAQLAMPPGLMAPQHLAFVLDDRIIAVPYVDFRSAPDGVDGSAGVGIRGGLTLDDARRIAAIIKTGPLPATINGPAPPPASG